MRKLFAICALLILCGGCVMPTSDPYPWKGPLVGPDGNAPTGRVYSIEVIQ